jgi:hypothetical protein
MVEKRISLSPAHAARLRELGRVYNLSEDEVLARALDLFATAARVLRPATAPSSRTPIRRPASRAEDAAERAALERLRDAGLILEIRPLPATIPDHEPRAVKGTPVSEIILAERR